MEEIYLNIIADILNKAIGNPGFLVSLEEICEIFISNRKRVLINDQADMCGIELQTVDIP